MAKAKPKWIRFSVEINAIDCLNQAAYFIQQTEINKSTWKWVVICLDAAVYGFAISVCQGSTPDSVKIHGKENQGEEKQRGKLISFNEAIRRSQSLRGIGDFASNQSAIITIEEKEAIKALHRFRNEFEHFSPKGWSIEIHGFPQIAIHCLNVIRKVLTETSTYMHVHLSGNQIRKIKSLIYQSKRILTASKLYKEIH